MTPFPFLSAQFRHVVFPGRVRRRKPALDLGVRGRVLPAPPRPEPSLSRDGNAFVRWLFDQGGLDARLYRPETLQRRLPACLRALRVGSPGQARQLLEATPTLIPLALGTMIISVTAFFRDPVVFDLLRDHVLPELSRSRSGLHVWSAGCSEGAELYSVALLLAERGLLANSYLLGTDCRADAIQVARRGCFDQASVRAVPPPLLARYFNPPPPGWQVVPAIRHAVRWRQADVLKAQEPGVWDLILFRNTAMYLRGEVASALWERFEASLRPGGVLVLGKAERPIGSARLTLLGPCLYRRNRG
jgi:chemotaxis methyl-accepting protein methylase